MKKAMILAAGRGERMGSLTANTPKPLLKIDGSYLIEYSIRALVNAGVEEIVINVSYLKEQIIDAIGDGRRYGVTLHYSQEEQRLETGGGIVKALPLLGSEPFIVLSADVITDYPLESLFHKPLRMVHLVMVENPEFKPEGDYSLNEQQELEVKSGKSYTFANVGLYRPELFAGCEPVYRRLPDIWQQALLQKQITGECYRGLWYNIGTPQDLESVEISATVGNLA